MKNLIILILLLFASATACGNASAVAPVPSPKWLKVRHFVPANNPDIYETELDSTHSYELMAFDPAKTVILIMDAWAYHPNDGWLERAEEHMTETLAPFLSFAREHNLNIVHSPNGYEIAQIMTPLPGELVIQNQTDFVNYLNDNKITTILYAGYASNWCVMNRPTGMLAMKPMGYKALLIRDATIAFETPKSFEGEWANRMLINFAEANFGGSTSIADIKYMLEGK